MKYPRKNQIEFLNDEAYYADKSFISNSMLKDFTFCPYKFEQKHHEGRFVQQDQLYFIIGRALDVLVTEGRESFDRQFQVVKRKLAGMTGVLNNSDYELVMGMYDEIMRQPLIQQLNFTPSKCQEIIALSVNGIKRKGKLDFLDLDKKLILDLKTCADLKKFDPLMYVYQLAYYRQLVRAKYNITADCHIFAVDKKKGRHNSQYYILSNVRLDEAEERINEALKLYKKSLKSSVYLPDTAMCHFCEFYSKCSKSVRSEPVYLI